MGFIVEKGPTDDLDELFGFDDVNTLPEGSFETEFADLFPKRGAASVVFELETQKDNKDKS